MKEVGTEQFNQGVEQQRSPDKYYDRLSIAMQQIAGEENAELNELQGERKEKYIDEDCRIDPQAFRYYNQESDEAALEAREQGWTISKKDINANVISHYQDKHNTSDPDEIIKIFKENQKKRNSNIAEMAVTGLMYKKLREKYFVLRSSNFDDVVNGIDTVIIDRETGEQICGFDEVNYMEKDKSQENELINLEKKDRLAEKKEKVIESARKPRRMKYGLQINRSEEPNLKAGPIENLPVFYLGISEPELRELVNDMNYNVNSGLTETEENIFSKLLISLREQKAMLDNEKKKNSSQISKAVQKKINKFEDFINKLEAV